MSAPTFFTHSEIAGVISDVNPFQNFFLNFFGSEHLSTTKEIHFDKISKDLRISTFQGWRRPGVAVPQRGFQVASIKPGYIKDKEVIEPDHVFNRRPGTPLAAPMSPSQNYAAAVVDVSTRMVDRLYRRMELMAVQLFRDGTYRMLGEDLDVTVDFGRAAGNSIVPTVAWTKANVATATPIADIEAAMDKATAPIRVVVMGTAAWQAVKRDPKFEKLVYINTQARDAANSPIFGPQQKNAGAMEHVLYRGTIAGADIYTYTATYDDPDTGTETLYIATDEVFLIPGANYGWQCFGLIMDAEADYQAMPYFIKNWTEKDPAIPQVLLQSAPLLAHTKINSTVFMNTGAD